MSKKWDEYLSGNADFPYQERLTKHLDRISGLMTQKTINEIVLWKVNRYAEIDVSILKIVNEIPERGEDISNYDDDKILNVVEKLLQVHGVRLPMASTILRFRNPEIFQIIDQRVYRYLYQDSEKKRGDLLSQKVADQTPKLYLEYLKDLKAYCSERDLDFSNSDRILYVKDKLENKDVPIKGYGASHKS